MTSPAPVGYSVRGATRDDLPAIGGLMAASDTADLGHSDYTGDQVRDDWSQPWFDPATDAWVVMDPQGGLAAYANLLGQADHTDLWSWAVVHPDHRGRGIGSFLVERMERRAGERARLAPRGRRVILEQAVLAVDTAAHRLLQGRGYEPTRHTFRMEIDLEGDLPDPAPPGGIDVRRLAAGDMRVVHDVLVEAFGDDPGWHPQPFDEFREDHEKRESFDPSLWLLATEGREVAGVATGALKTEGKGFVEWLAVRPGWRGRGIGEFLLRRLFAEFSRRGWDKASLFVDSRNPTGATRLYERVGMRVVSRYDFYAKRLTPG